MRFAGALVSVIMLVVSGCDGSSAPLPSNPLPYSENWFQPDPGLARLIVYYPYSRFWSGRIFGMTADVNVNSNPSCRLTSGNFFLEDVYPGKTAIAVAVCNGNAYTKLTLKTDPNQHYYIQIRPKDESLLGLIASHGIPENKEKTKHAEGSAFIIDVIDEPTAKTQLGSLKIMK